MCNNLRLGICFGILRRKKFSFIIINNIQILLTQINNNKVNINNCLPSVSIFTIVASMSLDGIIQTAIGLFNGTSLELFEAEDTLLDFFALGLETASILDLWKN